MGRKKQSRTVQRKSADEELGYSTVGMDARRENLKSLVANKKRKTSGGGSGGEVLDGGWYYCRALRGMRSYMEDNFEVDVAESFLGHHTGSGSPLVEKRESSSSSKKEQTEEEEEKEKEGGEESQPPNREFSFFGVFDGHGGTTCSKYCKSDLFEFIREHPEFPSNIPAALTSAFHATDKIICEMGDRICDGTTATVAVLEHGKSLWVAHVGDSRCVLVKDDGSVTALTRDHSCDLEDECARIEESGGFVVNTGDITRVQGVLAITRAIGDPSLKPHVIATPEIATVDLEQDPSAFLCIASDGVWETMSNEEAGKLIVEKGVRDGASEIATQALRRGSEDNITCMAVRLHGHDQLRAAPPSPLPEKETSRRSKRKKA